MTTADHSPNIHPSDSRIAVPLYTMRQISQFLAVPRSTLIRWHPFISRMEVRIKPLNKMSLNAFMAVTSCKSGKTVSIMRYGRWIARKARRKASSNSTASSMVDCVLGAYLKEVHSTVTRFPSISTSRSGRFGL